MFFVSLLSEYRKPVHRANLTNISDTSTIPTQKKVSAASFSTKKRGCHASAADNLSLVISLRKPDYFWLSAA